MVKLKKFICEAPILFLYKKFEVGTNFTLFYEAELVKLRVFND
jgi:hypothetical protein